MEFIKINRDRYMIKSSNNIIISAQEKKKLNKEEKDELVNKEIENVELNTIKKTKKSVK